MLTAFFLLDNLWIEMHYSIKKTILNPVQHIDPDMAHTIIQKRGIPIN